MFITILLSFILIVLVCNYYVPFGKKSRLLNLIPGPPGYPIIGNILDVLGTREEQMKNIFKFLDQYYPISKFWSFFFIVCIRHPDDLEIILSNKKHIEKSFVYNVVKPWLGTGLATSKAAKWHSRRKLLTPAFHFNTLLQFVDILIKEAENMTNSLKNTKGTVVNDLISFISEHTLNAICETALGTSLQDVDECQQHYRKSIEQITEIFTYRPWLYIDWIFSLTPTGRKQKKILKVLHGFTERIIAERKLYHKCTNGRHLKDFGNDTSAEKDDETVETRRKRLAMLDLLIAASRDGLITDLDIRQEVDTFVFAAHDTITKAICFVLMLLAEHKDIQDRVRDEINIAMRGNDQEKFTKELLQQLPYLERCIKEALRLYPSAPFISRVNGEDVKLQSYLVPAGTVMFIYIYGLHKDPNFWPNPEMFDPDRFLPENIRNRHPYSYIPFSAGTRNCIGQRFAMLEMKAMLASLIHNFYLEPIDHLKDLQLQVDLTLCPTHPLRMNFVPVKKINSSI